MNLGLLILLLLLGRCWRFVCRLVRRDLGGMAEVGHGKGFFVSLNGHEAPEAMDGGSGVGAVNGTSTAALDRLAQRESVSAGKDDGELVVFRGTQATLYARFVAGCHRHFRAVFLYPLEIAIDLLLLQPIYTFIL